MLYDFIMIDSGSKTPAYRQIYRSFRTAIENGSLKKGVKLQSIRRLCEELGVSRTTVIAAYDMLCAEGYIVSVPQSGYFVAAQFERKPENTDSEKSRESSAISFCEYDFSGKSINGKIIDLAEWRKNIRDVINRRDTLTSYGDAQGEYALREALQKYALGTRSVNSDAENIVVGAGTQPVLLLLCSLMGRDKRVAVAEKSFVQSEYVFKSFGYEVVCFESDENGATVESLERLKPDAALINPNYTEQSSESMPLSRRLEIIRWAQENGALIIEDDYNGELRYNTHPLPCVQNYGKEVTVYIGSFSKVLLPSVRISYMVLPEALMEKYREIKSLTNQTASKTEQLALAAYINKRKIDAHLRKARRIYYETGKRLSDCLREQLPEAKLLFNETSLYISVILPKSFDRRELEKKLAQHSVKIMPDSGREGIISLSFSGIAIEKIEEGVKRLAKVINKTE